MKALIVLLLGLAASSAYAQAACVAGAKGVAPTASLSFTAPTLNTDGTAVALPLTYNVYQSATSGAEVKVASGAKGAPIVINTAITSNTTFYWKITAVDANGVESAQSNEVCKAFPAAVPGTVTITIT